MHIEERHNQATPLINRKLLLTIHAYLCFCHMTHSSLDVKQLAQLACMGILGRGELIDIATRGCH